METDGDIGSAAPGNADFTPRFFALNFGHKTYTEDNEDGKGYYDDLGVWSRNGMGHALIVRILR